MKRKRMGLKGEEGFTLIEIIAILIILGILAAVAVPRYIDLTANAEARAIDAGVAELNGREALTWANEKISTAGWTDDATTFAALSTDLGTDYTWAAGDPVVGGGDITFESTTDTLTRTASITTAPGRWSK
ncbi:MAG: prepilin-type N-terminal cleavage/methylation domain-containing protein [Deltaproteobacteria bacterium]|nr:prepilin-type N-terminal cleavage/methylation domain-containing protein [Deltaproteobacteria bacterium]